MRCLAISAAVTLVMLAAPPAQSQDKPQSEKQKIEALIKHIEELKDAKFIRNDAEHDAKTAAKFLRGKWESDEKEIKTAKDFIEKAASKSSTSGKPYMMRLKDGKRITSREYLMEQLKKLEEKR
jgi:hypothetical protein